jgi:hypothetical protein
MFRNPERNLMIIKFALKSHYIKELNSFRMKSIRAF